MAPFARVPKVAAEAAWFTLLVGMAWALVHLSIALLPERRRSIALLFGLTLLLNAKALVKELAFGQFNLPLAVLLVCVLIAVEQRHRLTAGALLGVAVFVKPYALVMLPWLVWTQGWRLLGPFALVVAGGLLVPMTTFGWQGNLDLLSEWWRTVTQTTAPNLLYRENISFASLFAKWLGPGSAASWLALATSVLALGAGVLVLRKRRTVAAPNFLEVSYCLMLIPLLSPQGWDYVLLIAVPAYVCLVDRWQETPLTWKGVAVAGFILTSFAFYDLMQRSLYFFLMDRGAGTVGAMSLAGCLIRLRFRALA
jgi:hypothetical protein